MDVMLDDLVQDSEKLLMDVQGHTELPYITRNFEQMKSFGEKLLPRGPRSDVQAARLLGNKMSYELPDHLSAKLESLSAAVSTDVPSASARLDVQSFLKSERENALLNVVSITQQSLNESVDVRTCRALRSWWEQEAAAVLSALASSSGPLDTDLAHYTTGKVATDRGPIFDGDSGHGTSLTREELCYSEQLHRYLSFGPPRRSPFGKSLSSTEGPKNLLLFLAQENSSSAAATFESQRGPSSHSDLQEIWNLFYRYADFLSQSVLSTDPGQCAMERRASANVQRGLIECSLSHLEAEFVQFMQTTVAQNRRAAKLGGRPSLRALVKAYLNVDLPDANISAGDTACFPRDANGFEFEDGQVELKPVWAMIYHCLRAGDPRAAIEVAQQASSSLEDFASLLEEYTNNGRRLSSGSLSRLRQNSAALLKSTKDPYKRLVFSIIGLGPANEVHSEVARSIDDFLWLKLSQVVAQSTQPTASKWNSSEESITLSRLQTLLYETYGEVHFDAWSQPLVYFKILCLTLQFEGALGFLARFEALRCHAVHIALALHNQNLLLLPDSLQAPLVFRDESDPIGFRRLNLARIVMLYTRKFELNDPAEALMYFCFLADLKSSSKCGSDLEDSVSVDQKPQSVFNLCLTELVLATKQFDLLGSVTEAGIRKPGAIDMYCHTAEERQNSIASVAMALEARGQLIDAVSLYYLAACSGPVQLQFYEKAISLTNHLLAGLAQTDGSQVGVTNTPRVTGYPNRSAVMRLAAKLAQRVRDSDLFQDLTSNLRSEEPQFCWSGVKTLFYLLDLAHFLDLVQAEQWQTAIDHMDQLGLFPVNAQFEQVESKVAAFTELPDYVRRPLPAALIAFMRCLLAVATKQKSSIHGIEDTSNSALASIRNRAKGLIAYVGRIPYKLSSDVYARLTQMHMEIV